MSAPPTPAFEWAALVPCDVATAQCRWERDRGMVRMRALGMSLEAIGWRFNLTRGAVAAALRRFASKSPAERYLQQTRDIMRLADREMAVRAGSVRGLLASVASLELENRHLRERLAAEGIEA